MGVLGSLRDARILGALGHLIPDAQRIERVPVFNGAMSAEILRNPAADDVAKLFEAGHPVGFGLDERGPLMFRGDMIAHDMLRDGGIDLLRSGRADHAGEFDDVMRERFGMLPQATPVSPPPPTGVMGALGVTPHPGEAWARRLAAGESQRAIAAADGVSVGRVQSRVRSFRAANPGALPAARPPNGRGKPVGDRNEQILALRSHYGRLGRSASGPGGVKPGSSEHIAAIMRGEVELPTGGFVDNPDPTVTRATVAGVWKRADDGARATAASAAPAAPAISDDEAAARRLGMSLEKYRRLSARGGGSAAGVMGALGLGGAYAFGQPRAFDSQD